MIKNIFIKNFKAYEKETIKISKDNLLIGDNDSGKSTVLEALDIFFNKDKIEKELIRNPDVDVEIGVLVYDELSNYNFIKKIYKGKTGKFDSVQGDQSSLNSMSYVFIQANSIDVKKLIGDLAIAKVKQDITNEMTNQLQTLYENSINDVLSTIDGQLMIVGNGTTSFSQKTTLKLESAAKYDISSSGVPLEGRGSGYKKTVVYSLLTKSKYENVVIGIDEIENSLSIKNAAQLINIVENLFCQSIITTHSVHLMSCVNSSSVIPIMNNSDAETVADMLLGLGNIENKTFVLVEGKTDMQWINKVLTLIGKQDEYIVIQCGGSGNIDPVKNELIRKGFGCRVIKDGDTHCAESLSKECIELYITLEGLNSLFGLSETAVPTDKNTFFSLIKSNNPSISEDGIKDLIAENISSFLLEDNQLVIDVQELLA